MWDGLCKAPKGEGSWGGEGVIEHLWKVEGGERVNGVGKDQPKQPIYESTVMKPASPCGHWISMGWNTQQLRTLDALVEDLGLIPNTHMGVNNHL